MSDLWQTTQLSASASMQDAIKTLNNSPIKLVTVVEKGLLLGVITDGDIRRAILDFKPLETPSTEIMCRDPITANEFDSKAFVMSLLEKNKLQQIPIVDKNRTLKGIITKDGLLKKCEMKNTVFLMAGGFGTRLKPLTHSCPKPLLRIGKTDIGDYSR